MKKLIKAKDTINTDAINIEHVKISLVLEVRRCYSENWRHVENPIKELKITLMNWERRLVLTGLSE